MRFRQLYEDGESPDVSTDSSGGTTSADIANYTVKLGDVLRRKKIAEGIHQLNIADSIYVTYYCKNRSNAELKKCFDHDTLWCDVLNIFMKRTKNHNDIKITKNDESIIELENAIQRNCIANFIISFKEFKQYGTQIVFTIDDKDDIHDNCEVSIHQIFH